MKSVPRGADEFVNELERYMSSVLARERKWSQAPS